MGRGGLEGLAGVIRDVRMKRISGAHQMGLPYVKNQEKTSALKLF